MVNHMLRFCTALCDHAKPSQERNPGTGVCEDISDVADSATIAGFQGKIKPSFHFMVFLSVHRKWIAVGDR
jgi:hypothetical protein